MAKKMGYVQGRNASEGGSKLYVYVDGCVFKQPYTCKVARLMEDSALRK